MTTVKAEHLPIAGQVVVLVLVSLVALVLFRLPQIGLGAPWLLLGLLVLIVGPIKRDFNDIPLPQFLDHVYKQYSEHVENSVV